MPLYDNIADALALTTDGTTHTISLDNTGATFETNEAAETEPQEGVWAKIDLSAHLTGGNVNLTFDLVRTGGGAAFAPEFACFRVNDASFDPSSPDFSKLSYLTGFSYVGDGSTDPPEQTITVKGGPGSGTNQSATGIFYFVFNDYNYVEYGSASIDYLAPATPICYDSKDIINPDSTTASVVSGRVRETWDRYYDHGAMPYLVPEKTLKFTWTAAAGAYKMYASARPSADVPSSNPRRAWALVSVNGRALFREGPFANFDVTTPASNTKSWVPYPGLDQGDDIGIYNPSGDYANCPWVIVKPGDVVEVQLVADLNQTGFTFNPVDLINICFELDPNAPTTIYCTASVNFEDTPIGDEWGDDLGYGGQRVIPDEIYEELGFTIDSHGPSDFAWGFSFTDYDMAVLPDGTVYVLIKDVFNAAVATVHPHTTPFSNFESSYWFLAVKKYDPNTDTWTQVATLNFFDPIDGTGHAGGCIAGPHSVDSCNAYYDPIGGNVYFAWTEATLYSGTPAPTGPVKVTRDVYVAELDPSDDSWTYLGSGFHTQGVTQQSDNTGEDALGCDITVTDNGDVYVTTVETDDDATFGFQRKPYVWKWNGSTWTNLSLPAPSVVADNNWVLDGENQFWDQLVMVLPYRRDGSQDGVTVFYSFRYPTNVYRSVTIEYTPGGGWTDEIITNFATIESPDRANSSISFGDPPPQLRAFDMTMLWSAKFGRLVLTTDMVGNSTEEIWDMFQMNDDGNQWELLEPSAPPASSGGPWRQARNSADIGPDGDVWRGMVSDSIGLNFEPHVIKHAPGYGQRFINGARNAIGYGATPYWTPFVGATSNHRIRWAGNQCFIITNLTGFATNYNVGGGDASFGDGIYVFRGTYVPCASVPIYGSIKFP